LKSWNTTRNDRFHTFHRLGDTVSLLVGRWTRDLQVAGLNPGRASLRSGLGQATYAGVPLSPSSIIWYQPRGWSLWLGN